MRRIRTGERRIRHWKIGDFTLSVTYDSLTRQFGNILNGLTCRGQKSCRS